MRVGQFLSFIVLHITLQLNSHIDHGLRDQNVLRCWSHAISSWHCRILGPWVFYFASFRFPTCSILEWLYFLASQMASYPRQQYDQRDHLGLSFLELSCDVVRSCCFYRFHSFGCLFSSVLLTFTFFRSNLLKGFCHMFIAVGVRYHVCVSVGFGRPTQILLMGRSCVTIFFAFRLHSYKFAIG